MTSFDYLPTPHLAARWLTRTAVALGALVGVVAVASAEGCGPGDTRYYCDSSGCYNCDGYGCHPVTPPANTQCTGDKSCAQNQVCTSKGCETVCKADTDCPQGETCQSGLCAAPNTNPGTTLQCTTKADCTAGEECVGNKCEACGGTNGPCSCAVNTDCASGQVCSGGLCIDKSSTCSYSSECGAGKVCADGECLVDCSMGQMCPSGTACEKGVCEPNGSMCKSDADCSGGTPKCVDGTCTAACDPVATTNTCGTGNYCDQGACVPDTRPQPDCSNGSQCLSTQECLDGFCRYTCMPGSGGDTSCKLIDTRIGYCAADGTCRDAQEAQAECLSSADCQSGKICISNQCE